LAKREIIFEDQHFRLPANAKANSNWQAGSHNLLARFPLSANWRIASIRSMHEGLWFYQQNKSGKPFTIR